MLLDSAALEILIILPSKMLCWISFILLFLLFLMPFEEEKYEIKGNFMVNVLLLYR